MNFTKKKIGNNNTYFVKLSNKSGQLFILKFKGILKGDRD